MTKEDRRAQILSAAMGVFVEKGFSGSTTLEIAKAAEVSEVTLFRYFDSKQEIFLAGIEPILLSTLQGSIDLSSELSPRAKLEYILFERIRLISDNHQIVRLILSEASFLSSLGSESFMKRITKMLQTLLRGIGISSDDKEFSFRLLMGSILSFLYLPQQDEESIRQYVKKVAGILLNQQNDQENYQIKGGIHGQDI